MHDIERRVWREARAMTRREVITKQLSWVQAAEILGISARHMRRLRSKVERWGMSAVTEQRDGRGGKASRPAPPRCYAGTSASANPISRCGIFMIQLSSSQACR